MKDFSSSSCSNASERFFENLAKRQIGDSNQAHIAGIQ